MNANRVEDALQRELNGLPLGTVRLWRHVAKGGYTDDQKFNNNNLFKVFLTYAPSEAIEKNGWTVSR